MEQAPSLYARLRGGPAPPLPQIPRRLRFERADGETRVEVAALRRPWWVGLGLWLAAVAAVAALGVGAALWAMDGAQALPSAGLCAAVLAGAVAAWVGGWRWWRRLVQVGFYVLVNGAGIRYAQVTPQGRGPTPIEGFWPHHRVTDVVVRCGLGGCALGILAGPLYVPLAVGLTRAEASAARALITRAIAQA